MSDNKPPICADITVVLESIITCPECGHRETETMPTDNCQFYYECKGCGVMLHPKQGDCCVYCSFGTVPCPPIQEARQKDNVQHPVVSLNDREMRSECCASLFMY